MSEANSKLKTKESPSDEARAVLLLGQIQCQLGIHLQENLVTYELTPQQFNLLRILRGAKNEKVNSKILRERLIDKNADVSRLIGRLLEKGLIELIESTSDRRQRWVQITSLGLKKLSQIDKDNPGFPFDFVDHLSKDEISLLNALLAKVLEK